MGREMMTCGRVSTILGPQYTHTDPYCHDLSLRPTPNLVNQISGEVPVIQSPRDG